jgi:Histone methylation protein DOT1
MHCKHRRLPLLSSSPWFLRKILTPVPTLVLLPASTTNQSSTDFPSYIPTKNGNNALSRTNAYWPYIQKGDTPPEELIYGEFDFFFFAKLLDRACALWDREHVGTRDDKVFCDLGSGSGRLVLAAAALHPWQLCRGVELLPGIHMLAVDNLALCRTEKGHGDDDAMVSAFALPSSSSTAESGTSSCPISPVELICGSFEDPYFFFGDSDIVFVFSSCMGADLGQAGLSRAIGRQCRPGTIVISTDYLLPLEGTIPPDPRDDRLPSGTFRLGLIEQLDGWCWLTGGSSTAYIHKVEESLWKEGQRKLEPLELSLQDKALDVIHALESGELTDTKAFLRNVRNNMIFYGFPEQFLPQLK